MATMQFGNGSAYNILARSSPRIGPEYPTMTPLPAENHPRRQTPRAEPHFRSLWSDPNAPMQKRLGEFGSDPSAPFPFVMEVSRARVFGFIGDLEGPQANRPALGGNVDSAISDGASPGDDYRLFRVPEPHWLAEALAALAEVDDEIAEEDLPPVGEATKTEAERIIKALARHPLAPTVYPTQDAEIALHFKAPGRTGTVVILLSDGGRADCHAYVGGTSRRAHYDTSSDLPDAFVLDQLRRLTPPSRAAVSTPAAGFLQFGTTFLLTNLLRTR